MKWIDLGLTYLEAVHGIQSCIAYIISRGSDAASPKHLRTGLDVGKAEHAALAYLLIKKGVFTEEEYLEEIRLACNDELNVDQKRYGVTFR